MNRMIRSDCKYRIIPLNTPSIHTIPILVFIPVFRRIFKVTILNQLCIESAVCRIIQVFKEYPYQMLTDRLSIFFFHFDSGRHRFQSCKTASILRSALSPQCLSVRPVIPITVHRNNLLISNFQSPTGHLFVTYPHRFSNRLIAVLHGIFSFFRCHKEMLRFPFYQINRRYISHRLSIRSQIPETMPCSVHAALRQIRFIHFLPRAEVTLHEYLPVSYILPIFPVRTPDKLHSSPSSVI